MMFSTVFSEYSPSTISIKILVRKQNKKLCLTATGFEVGEAINRRVTGLGGCKAFQGHLHMSSAYIPSRP